MSSIARHPPAVRLTGEQVDTVVDAVDDALAEADLTVDELDVAVVERAGAWAGELVVPAFDGWWPRWRLAIPTSAYRGVLCFGADRGRRTVYASPRRWVAGFSGPSGTGGLATLVLEYLASYGPATADQVALWLGVPATAMRTIVATMAGELVQVDLGGSPAYLPAADADSDPGGPGGEDDPEQLHLLPYFDPYVVGCHPRSSLFPGEAAERALTRGQAGTRAVLLLGGTVAGVWHHRRRGRAVHLTVQPFDRLSRRHEQQLDAQVQRVGAILEATPSLTIGTVTARSHL
jgi:hypothetical protein